MLQQILNLDVNLFLFLNSLGSEKYDKFWLFITNKLSWTPLFIFLAYFAYKKSKNLKSFLILILFVAALILLTDQLTNLFKFLVHRSRPCNNAQICNIIRVVKSSKSFSFFSGHAANSMAVTTFFYMLFRKQSAYFLLLFFWPIIFAYSRIYLGLHYPIDIICGFIFGMITGFLMFRLYKKNQI